MVFNGLKPASRYLLTYHLQGQPKLTNVELQSLLARINGDGSGVTTESGVLLVMADSLGTGHIKINQLAINTFYNYSLYSVDDIEDLNTLSELKPVFTNSFLTYTYYNDYLISGGRLDAGDSARLSGWIGNRYRSN